MSTSFQYGTDTLTTGITLSIAAGKTRAVLGETATRIINEVKGVNRVFYDCTSKPPGTIELE